MGLFWLVMGHVFHMISYVDCDVDCDMDSYVPGGGGMLTTDIEASRWFNRYVCRYNRIKAIVESIFSRGKDALWSFTIAMGSWMKMLELNE